MKGYKATNFDMTCRGFQFEVGNQPKWNMPRTKNGGGYDF